ncbi:hypothetical protein [Dolosigranulum pigrum]|uniref:hypothetical protein n=1 Tax=Dolosigranulum pigrum TaxID=29394 RepID=UPI003CC74976
MSCSMQDISTRLKESTLMTFETRVENHILPSIGHKIIHKITTRELQELVNSWANKGSLPMLINNLKRLFKYAQKINALDSNPINGVIFPSKRKKRKIRNSGQNKNFSSSLKQQKITQILLFILCFVR